MGPRDVLVFHNGVVLIDLIGGLLVAGYAAAAVRILLRTGAVARARLLVADGAVLGLGFKTAGTLLKALEVHTWDQIGMFGAVLAVRVVLKRLFKWERARVERGRTAAPP